MLNTNHVRLTANKPLFSPAERAHVLALPGAVLRARQNDNEVVNITRDRLDAEARVSAPGWLYLACALLSVLWCAHNVYYSAKPSYVSVIAWAGYMLAILNKQ